MAQLLRKSDKKLSVRRFKIKLAISGFQREKQVFTQDSIGLILFDSKSKFVY